MHGGEVNESEAKKHNNRYYHEDCLQRTLDKQEIRKLYLEKINPAEVVKNLNSVINTIVETKGVDSSYLLFALNYCINNNIKISSPYGLHYIINNKTIKELYQNINNPKKLYGNYIMLTSDEYYMLSEKMGENKLLNYIDRLDRYIESTKKQYDSHYNVILNWFNKENNTIPSYGNNIVIHSS
jgi:hypothetical protein